MSRSPSSFAFHPRSKFDAFLEGQLSASADEKVQAHLAECDQCAREVQQRWSALSVTQKLERLSRNEPHSAETQNEWRTGHTTWPAGEPATVMQPHGVAGWKVLVGAGVLGLVVVGLFTSLWMLGGDDRSYESADSSSPVLIPEQIEVVQADPQDLIRPTPSDDSTKVPTDFQTTSAQLSYTSAPLGIDGTPVRLTSVSDLRAVGWTIPQFQALGMAFESAVVDEEDGQVYVMSVFNGTSVNSEDQTVVRECRAEHEDGSVTACSRLDFTDSAAVQISLPVAENVWVYTYPDGSWTAYMATSKSQYRVDSTSDANYAGGIMSTLYVEEKSRLSSGTGQTEEGVSQRFERGVERLLGR